MTECAPPRRTRHQELLLEREAHVERILGKRLAAIRDARMLSIGELAALSGIQEDELVHYEEGAIPIALSRVRLIAATLDIPPMELFTRLVCPAD